MYWYWPWKLRWWDRSRMFVCVVSWQVRVPMGAWTVHCWSRVMKTCCCTGRADLDPRQQHPLMMMLCHPASYLSLTRWPALEHLQPVIPEGSVTMVLRYFHYHAVTNMRMPYGMDCFAFDTWWFFVGVMAPEGWLCVTSCQWQVAVSEWVSE